MIRTLLARLRAWLDFDLARLPDERDTFLAPWED